ncbi:MAG: dTDP-4-dehydrorhamnose 3,5-epimerase [Planctomycetota bacterium]|jgi:dTDP-4-dehydrorhamnose 3,5-epimerase
MEVIETAIPDVKIIVPQRFGDHRGFFSETYNARKMSEAGIGLDFVQDNHSLSAQKGVVRGLHFQVPPFAQDKLVRVSRGAVIDVAVDIRRSSPTFGQHVAITLSADNWRQLLIPKGFAHGFVTLQPDTEVQYKVTADYAPDCDRGVMWNDPALAIDWGLHADDAILSEKDTALPLLEDCEDLFD